MIALKAKTRAAVLQIAEWQLGVVEMPTNSNKVKYNTAYYGREVSGALRMPGAWPLSGGCSGRLVSTSTKRPAARRS